MGFLRMSILRRLTVFLAIFVLGLAGVHLAIHSGWNKGRLYRQLIASRGERQLNAAAQLVWLGAEEELVQGLKARDEATWQVAQNAVWSLWLREAGKQPYEQVLAAGQAMADGDVEEASRLLDLIVDRHPDFAEAWNRRSALDCRMGDYDRAFEDALRAVQLRPNHFSAWQTLGMCQARLGDLEGACVSLRRSLGIHPHEKVCRELLRSLEKRLEKSPSRKGVRIESI